MATQKQTRGLRNNNPGNIEINSDKFQGEVIPSKDSRFKQFTTMAYAYRAMFAILSTYLKRSNNTIEKIIKVWAPPVENNTEGYIASVEKWSGVPRNKVLTPNSGKDCIQIVAAMSRVENGVVADMADVITGYKLQDRII